jgi:magnesium transporter
MMSRKTNHGDRKRRPKAWKTTRAPKYAPPGTLTIDPAAPRPVIRVIAYSVDSCVDQPVHDVQAIQSILHRYPVTWVNVDGLGDLEAIKAIGEIFTLHRLALEDVVHVRQRPKLDEYAEHLYIVARMLERVNGRLATEQLSMFVGNDFVLTFQERPGDCLDAIRRRVCEKLGRVRDAGPDYLAYAILDAVIDDYFPVIEACGDRLEDLEDDVVANPAAASAQRVYSIRRDLLVLRRAMWPLREVVNGLQRSTSKFVADETRIYLRDAYDHTVQVLDLIEIYRELAAGLVELYMTSASHRMNQIMKVLTIIATIFIPLTFIVGIYGMNFDPDVSPYSMPELRWPYGYIGVMIFMAVLALFMIGYFWHKGWLRREAVTTAQAVPKDGRD